MAFTKITYSPGDVLTSEQMNNIQDAIVRAEGNYEAHVGDRNNPHGVTLEQLGVTASNTELNYLTGVTSNVQEQLETIKKMPGEKGEDGKDGVDGEDGYTPVKGVDYFTEADKAELVAMVIEELPSGDEVSY